MSYEIGYGKPPVHSRFRKGQSGNPGGRPGPRRAAERRVQAELEEQLLLSPDAFARLAPRDGFGAVAADLTRGATGGKAAAVRLLFSFVSERGTRRPRRVRLPARIRQKLNRAMSQGILEAAAEKTQTQGITPAHRAQGPGSCGAVENAEVQGPRSAAMRNLRELRGVQAHGYASQGIMCRARPVASHDSYGATEGTEFRCHSTVRNLREIHDIRGPPQMCRLEATLPISSWPGCCLGLPSPKRSFSFAQAGHP